MRRNFRNFFNQSHQGSCRSPILSQSSLTKMSDNTELTLNEPVLVRGYAPPSTRGGSHPSIWWVELFAVHPPKRLWLQNQSFCVFYHLQLQYSRDDASRRWSTHIVSNSSAQFCTEAILAINSDETTYNLTLANGVYARGCIDAHRGTECVVSEVEYYGTSQLQEFRGVVSNSGNL